MRQTASLSNRVSALALGLVPSLALLGCANVPAYQQDRLSKPAMTFSDSLADASEPALLSQLEPGSDTSGGAQSSGCSACR